MEYKSHLRASEAEIYKPGEFIQSFDDRRSSMGSFRISSALIPDHNIFKNSIVGNTSFKSDQFYKSQVIERGIGGEPVYLNAINHYKPLSGADDPQIMDQIRQEHLRIMDDKLGQAITSHGGNAMQQVKTIIVEPISQVVELNTSVVSDQYHGIARKSSFVNTTGIVSNPSNRASKLTISPIPSPRTHVRTSQMQGPSQVQYIPFERKVTQLETREITERVPVQKRVIQYENRTRLETVPVSKTVLDYYAVEHVTSYQPQIVEQKIIEMVPIQKTIQTTNYIPFQQKIVYSPNNMALRRSIVQVQQPTQSIKARQSIITYESPQVMRSNSISSNNQGRGYERRTTRNPSFITKLNSIESINNNLRRPSSPIRVQNPNININNKGFQYTKIIEQPITFVHNPQVLPSRICRPSERVVHQPFQQRRYLSPPIMTTTPSQPQNIRFTPNQFSTNINKINYNQQPPLTIPQTYSYEQNLLKRQRSGYF